MDRRLGRRCAALWLLIFMLATSCNIAYATKYSYGLTQTTATVRTPTVQLQPGTAGSSTISNGVYAAVTVTASAIPLCFVPVTLTNSQGSPTPNPFQVLIQPNPSSYSAYEASDLGNVRFCADTFCTTPLYSWLEGCGTTSPYGTCSTSSTSAAFWVRLTSAIPSGGTLTIYMAFLSTSTDFDGNVAGESPQLSTTYGHYDNGANVFLFYDNFAGTTLNTAKWITAASSGSVTVNNGATFTTTSTSGYAFVVSTTQPATQASPAIAEAYMVSESGNVDPMLGVSTSTTVNSWVAFYNGYSVDDCPSACGGPGLEIAYQLSTGGGVVISHTEGFNPGVWRVVWSANGVESASDGAITLTGTDTRATMANYGIYVGQSNIVAGSNVVRWARMRAYPPGNTMPSVSFGSVTSAASGVILTFSNSGSSSWLANLAVVGTPTNAARLTNLTISFESPLSKQVILGTGVTNQNVGPQVTLGASSTLSIIMGVTVSSSGTSTVTLGLKIQNPPSSGSASVYCYDIISLTVN